MKSVSYVFGFVMAALMVCSQSVSAVELTKDLSLGGFADGQFIWTKEAASEGFILNDAALYLKYTKPKVHLFVDLPFQGRNSGDVDFNFATSKAQAFITLLPVEGFEIVGGQFDAIFGHEAADSYDSIFTQAATNTDLIPVEHLGAMISFTRDAFNVKALVSNPNNLGQLKGTNPAFGLQAGYTAERGYLTAGTLMHNQQGQSGMECLYDFMAGVNFSKFSLDEQFDIRQKAAASNGYQSLTILKAQLTEEFSLAARGNWLRQADGTNYDVMQATFGPQYAFKGDYEGLKLKADYSWTGTEAVKDTTRQKEHTIAVAALFGF